MSYPYWKQGPYRQPVTFFYELTIKKLKKNGLCMSDCNYWLQYSPNGCVQCLQPKPWISSIKLCARYCTGAPPRPSKWPEKLFIFLLSFCLLLPWQPLGWYIVNSHPMAASSGFQGSPQHAASGNAVCVAPMCLHGHWNGPRQRCICFLPALFLLTIIVAKDHVKIH